MQNNLDYYAHSNGLRDMNIQLKILLAIITMMICIIATSPVIPLSVAFILSYILIFKAKIPSKFYFKFLAVPLIFAFITLIYMTLFFGVQDPWFNIGFFTVYKDGFNLGILVFSRIIGSFTCLGFLALTTPMNELFSTLESIKVPQIVIEISMLMYRYIFVFLGELENMRNSQKTRLGYTTVKGTFRSLGLLTSNLFIRTWLRGEQVYITMESRCYGGTIKTLETHKRIEIKNILLLLSFESFLLLGTYLTWGFKVI